MRNENRLESKVRKTKPNRPICVTLLGEEFINFISENSKERLKTAVEI